MTNDTAQPAQRAGGVVKVRGRCPSCDGEHLFVGSGGYVTCSLIGCADPCAADIDTLAARITEVEAERDEAIRLEPLTVADFRRAQAVLESAPHRPQESGREQDKVAALRSELEAAEGRIEQAREVLKPRSFIHYSPEHRAEVFRLRAMDARTILTEPAKAEGKFAAAQRLTLEDAEGIASEVNPHDWGRIPKVPGGTQEAFMPCVADAPSAEADLEAPGSCA